MSVILSESYIKEQLELARKDPRWLDIRACQLCLDKWDSILNMAHSLSEEPDTSLFGVSTCAFCHLYYPDYGSRHDEEDDGIYCNKRCPIVRVGGGESYCEETPYYEAQRAACKLAETNNEDYKRLLRKDLIDACKEEVDLLENILTQLEKEVLEKENES